MPKKWIPPENIYDLVTEYRAAGNTERSIHLTLGISQSKWYELKREDPKLAEAVEEGKINDELLCMNRLRQIAFDDKNRGSLTALIYYTKVNFGWNDGSKVDNSKPKPSKITFNTNDRST